MTAILSRGFAKVSAGVRWNPLSRLAFSFQERKFSVPPLQTSSKDTEVSGSNFNNMKVYEIRIYSINPKDFKDFIKLAEENVHIRIKHSKLFGFWSTELGGLNEVVHIWEYDNHDHRAKVRQAIANDTEWQNSFIAKIAPMLLRQDNATMMLLPWSIITLPSKSGVYELQMFNMNSHTDIWDGRLKAAMELSTMKLKDSNSVLIAAFTTVFGQHNTVYALWQHESFDKFAFGRLQLLSETNKSVFVAICAIESLTNQFSLDC